eukprot:6201063-Pleurochrysis_carterae.AAC.1
MGDCTPPPICACCLIISEMEAAGKCSCGREGHRRYVCRARGEEQSCDTGRCGVAKVKPSRSLQRLAKALASS